MTDAYFALIDNDRTRLSAQKPSPVEVGAFGPAAHHRSKRQKMYGHGSFGRKSLRKSQPLAAMGNMSPPVLRTSRSTGSFSPAVFSDTPDRGTPGSQAGSDGNGGTAKASGTESSQARPQTMEQAPTTAKAEDPAARHGGETSQTVEHICDRLRALRQEMGQQSADRAVHAMRETSAAVKDRRVHHGRDLFANCRSTAVPAKQQDSMKIKFKQHLRHKKDSPEEHHVSIPIKSSKERVPQYKFHHVEIERNIITPRSMHTFVPHLKDVDEKGEMAYEKWLKELEDTDKQLGFTNLSPERKRLLAMQSEKAALLSLYLEYWLEELAIPGCTMASVFRLAGPDDSDKESGSQRSERASNQERNKPTESFIEAFRRVFSVGPQEKRIELRQVLRYCQSTDNVMESQPTARDDLADEFEDEDEQTEAVLGSYSILGCQICHQQSCEHGEYDANDQKQYFTAKLPDLLKRRRQDLGDRPLPVNRDLRRLCRHEASALADCPPSGRPVPSTPWTDKQKAVLRALWYTLLEFKDFEDDPRCQIASWFNKPCREVRLEIIKMDIVVPDVPPPSTIPVKTVSWYDRYKKALHGNWQDHLKVNLYNKRETVDSCSHEGPCRKGHCPCVDKGLLCEKFCGCTLECCAYKFNGCACHARGKNCMEKQKDRPCICVLLNRECDPSLCGSCGIKEDTEPNFEHDKDLIPPRRRCHNSDLQRGVEKAVVVGESQLQNVGYGLYTAEAIAQDEFVMEYRGEIITHDEGTRRAARRGPEEPSFSFTLLDADGIWIDALMYGNLSRYINHAPQKDRWGCNIVPKIVYVNGEFRIKFIALRNIAVGEELFFNYGEHFPDVNEQPLNDTPVVEKTTRRKSRTQQQDGLPKRSVGRPRRKDSTQQPDKRRRSRTIPDSMDLTRASESELGEDEPGTPAHRRTRKRKHADIESPGQDEDGNAASSDDEDEYRGANNDKSPATSARLRAMRKQRKTGQPTAEAAAPSNKPIAKPKGKRGGARPGSGRPRKHPLPVAKDASSAPTSGAKTPAVVPEVPPAAATTELPVAAASSSPRPAAPSPPSTRKSTSKTPAEDSPRTRGPVRRSFARRLIPDSEDESSTPQEPELHSSSDEEDGDEEDSDNEKQRKLEERARRTRRPPRKFKGEEVWRGRSSSQ